MNKFQTLIVLTQSYPFDKAQEKTFLQDEILQLSGQFLEIYIIPKETKYVKYGNIGNAICVNEFDNYLSKKLFLFDLKFYRNLIVIFYHEIKFSSTSFDLKSLLVLIKSAFLASAFLTWFSLFYLRNNLQKNNVLIYSFWFDSIVSSLSWFKNKSSYFTVVTRCHSIDLYEERRETSYIPFRSIAIKNLDFIFPDSNRGANYLSCKYPEFDFKIQTLFQGVLGAHFSITNSSDGKLRFISCSYVSKRKRVDQIFNVLNAYSLLYPQNLIEWYHIGSGPDFEELSNLVQSKSETFNVHLLGNLDHSTMFEFYKNNELDFFLNFSENEGTPVSLMEAASCGFAFIVTDVGGNSDLVTPQNGFIIDPSINIDQVVGIINQVFNNKHLIINLSKESKFIWQKKFNLNINTLNFVRTVNRKLK